MLYKKQLSLLKLFQRALALFSILIDSMYILLANFYIKHK